MDSNIEREILAEAAETPKRDEKISVVTSTIEGVAVPRNKEQNQGDKAAINKYNNAENKQDTQNPQLKETLPKKRKIKKPQTCFESVWYVALTNTKCEREVERQILHSDLYVKTWIPTEVGKHNTIHNFVFFHFSKSGEKDYGTKQSTFTKIRCISNVNDILTAPDEYTPTGIPNSQVERFRKAIGDKYHHVEYKRDAVCVGEKVRVVKGSLAGLSGTVEHISEKKSKLYISLANLGCAIVEIGEDDKYVIEGNTSDSNEKKDITDEIWLSKHPYDEMQSEDYKYVEFANRLVAALAKQFKGISLSIHKRLSLLLTCYIEDKRSRLGQFHYLVTSYSPSKHPIETLLQDKVAEDTMTQLMNGYDAKSLNAIDIAYILLANGLTKKKDIETLVEYGKTLIEKLQKMRYDRLTPNRMYFGQRRDLLETGGWEGLKQFLLWIANSKNVFIPNAEPINEVSALLTPQQADAPVSPLQFTLEFEKRTRVATSVIRMLERLAVQPKKEYTVIGAYRKVIHFKDDNGELFKTVVDKVSQGTYVKGERYSCQLVKYDNKEWWYHLSTPFYVSHKVLEYRDITAENLALMTDEEFINANHAFINTINKHRESLVSNKWLSSEDIDAYIVAFRKAEDAKGKDDYPKLRKEVEEIIVNWNQGDLNPNRTDVYDDEFYKITDALYLNMQHTDYLTDEEWQAKYKDLTADRRSEVVELRKAASDYVPFTNPYRKEMEAAWQLPDGYENEEVYEALSPVAAYLPKAMSLYENGETINALGVCFDLFDMVIVMMSRELKFFFDDEGGTTYPWALAEVALYPICKIYNDKSTPQEVKSEIFNRIEEYGKTYGFPKKLDTGHVYEPVEVFNEFATFERELEFNDFFGLNPYNIHEPEEAEALSDEEFETWRLKIFKEVSAIGDFHKYSTEELSLLSNVLKDMYLFPDEDIEQACSVGHFNAYIEGVKTELQSRSIASTDIDESTISSWATTQNADGSWTDVSAEEAYGRIRVIGNIVNPMEDVDKDRITFLAYNYYSQTSCTTARELHAKFMAYETKYRRLDEQSPAFIHRQAIAMLQSESLSLADRLLLYDILL